MLARIYGFDAETVSNLTIAQFNAYMQQIEYVVEESKKFGKPPAVELPMLEIVKYARRCSVDIPYDVHLDLLQGGEL